MAYLKILIIVRVHYHVRQKPGKSCTFTFHEVMPEDQLEKSIVSALSW